MKTAPQVLAAAYLNGWPADPTAFDNADAIMLYMDGGGQHPVATRQRLAEIDQFMKRGVGLICAHYAVEVEKEQRRRRNSSAGSADISRPIWSVNPTWMMTKPILAKDHPITRGVKPFDIKDEWYYHMRFRPNMEGVTPILSAVPPDDTRQGKRRSPRRQPGRAGRHRQECAGDSLLGGRRPDGGRGYGFTGGHYHRNWGNDDYRKLMLNAILWVAKAEVPADGVNSTVTEEDLKANLDKKGR